MQPHLDGATEDVTHHVARVKAFLHAMPHPRGLGPGIAARLSEDRKGAGLALPDGSHWQFRVAGEYTGTLSIEDSLFVDGDGRPQPIQQLVLQGMAPRSGGSFAWLFKKMG